MAARASLELCFQRERNSNCAAIFDMKTITLLIAIAALTGCALNRPRLVEETETPSTNGVAKVRRELKVTSFVLWPAKEEVSNQKASLGKTLSTGVSTLSQEGGGTNVVEALKSIDSILGKVK